MSDTCSTSWSFEPNTGTNLFEYVRAMQGAYLLGEHSVSNSGKVERVIRQAYPTFTTYLRNGQFHNLDDLATEAERIQGDILIAHAYHPPPPVSLFLEPQCTWHGGNVLPAPFRQTDAMAAPVGETG